MTPDEARLAVEMLDAKKEIDDLLEDPSTAVFIAAQPKNCTMRPATTGLSANRLWAATVLTLQAESTFLAAELEKLGVTL